MHYHREGRWRFQKARNVVVAGYAIETPRLLLNSANDRFPDGLANSSGLVGKNLMTQSNQAVWGVHGRGGALVQGAALARDHRALELRRPQGLSSAAIAGWRRGRCRIEWATVMTGVARAVGRRRCASEMMRYNHQVGLKMVGEMLPDERNRVTLADEKDQYGLRIPRITYTWGDNDKALIQHALDQMQPEPGGGRRERHLPAGGRHQPPRRHRAHGRRSAQQRRQRRLPQLGYSQSVGLRRLGLPDDGGVNPSLTIQAIACAPADRIKALAARGEL